MDPRSVPRNFHPPPQQHPLHSSSARTSTHPVVSNGNSEGDSSSKKRRTSTTTTSRGVANLTPEQLAKKRANDREAQRAIRERTKTQIESLENKIRDLSNQQPYQELQTALKQKQLVEAENVHIKQKLNAAMLLLQPLVGAHGGSTFGTNRGPHVYTHAHCINFFSQQSQSSRKDVERHQYNPLWGLRRA
ncbi:MAG: hypothetical protein Q9224_006304 [Gallowayella concinna]